MMASALETLGLTDEAHPIWELMGPGAATEIRRPPSEGGDSLGVVGEAHSSSEQPWSGAAVRDETESYW